jgi:hypothetical protein
MISPSLSVCLCLSIITFETTSRFYDIQYRGHAIGDDLGAIMFNPVQLGDDELATARNA